jgi:hypothetical protein
LVPALFAAGLYTSPLYAQLITHQPSRFGSRRPASAGNWVKHLEANGFAVTVNATDSAALERLKAQVGIGNLPHCHTAKIGG